MVHVCRRMVYVRRITVHIKEESHVKNKKVRKPVEVGSRRWYWRMAGARMSLWLLPVLPGVYGTMHTDWGAPRDAVLAMSLPWYAIAVSLVLMVRALWRIEINIIGNSARPFTEKDGRIFKWAVSIITGLAVSLATFSLFLEFDDLPVQYRDAVSDSLSSSLIVFVVTSSISITLANIHRKGMATHESLTKAQAELEKGV